jgi:hypothetical protein
MTTLTSYDEAPSRLDMAIALFTRTGTSEAHGGVHARSVRIPTIEHVTIDALAEYSGLSANKVIVQLLEVALDEVTSGMTNEQRGELFAIRSKILGKRIDKDGYPIFPDVEQSKEGEI